MAATTLSGFLQCSFLSMDPPMQAHFEALCKTRLPKKRKRELGSIVDTIPSAGGSPNCWVTCFNVRTTRCYFNKLFSSWRPGAAPRWRPRPECLYSVQPVWCPHLDAPAVDGPERSPEWHATHRGKCAIAVITLLVRKGGAITCARFQMTVKKTLSNFRRTHHDNWQQHKQQFTDDQLLVLTDLLVSPCYYAWNLVKTSTSQKLLTLAHPKDGRSADWVTQFVFHRQLPHCEGSLTPEKHPEGLKSVFMYLAPLPY